MKKLLILTIGLLSSNTGHLSAFRASDVTAFAATSAPIISPIGFLGSALATIPLTRKASHKTNEALDKIETSLKNTEETSHAYKKLEKIKETLLSGKKLIKMITVGIAANTILTLDNGRIIPFVTNISSIVFAGKSIKESNQRIKKIQKLLKKNDGQLDSHVLEAALIALKSIKELAINMIMSGSFGTLHGLWR